MSGDGEDHDLEGWTAEPSEATPMPQPSLGEVSELFRTLVSVDIDPESKAEGSVKAQAVVVAGLDYCARYIRSLARSLPA
jgi:hypothetical protein